MINIRGWRHLTRRQASTKTRAFCAFCGVRVPANERPCFKTPHSKEMAFRLKMLCNWLINRLSSDHASNALTQPKHPAKCHLRVSNKNNKICHFFHWILASYGRVGYTKMAFAQVAKGYLSTIANKNSFSLITNMRVASVSTGCAPHGSDDHVKRRSHLSERDVKERLSTNSTLAVTTHRLFWF